MPRHAERSGFDAVLLTSRLITEQADAGRLLPKHFKAINDAIGIPIIIYNILPKAMVDMSVDTMKRLAELPRNRSSVPGDATGDVGRVSRQRHARDMGPEFIQLSLAKT